MGDSRKHLLNSIDIAFSLYRSRSDSAIPEEELQQFIQTFSVRQMIKSILRFWRSVPTGKKLAVNG